MPTRQSEQSRVSLAVPTAASWPSPGDLLAMSWADAQRAKWNAGRAHHGPQWVGAPPLLELYVELVDAAVYLDEAKRRRDLGQAAYWALRCALAAVGWGLRSLLRRRSCWEKCA